MILQPRLPAPRGAQWFCSPWGEWHRVGDEAGVRRRKSDVGRGRNPTQVPGQWKQFPEPGCVISWDSVSCSARIPQSSSLRAVARVLSPNKKAAYL